MNNSYIISNEIDYISESIELLEHIGSKETYHKLKQNIAVARFVNTDNLDKMTEILELIQVKVQKALCENLEEISYYFAKGERKESIGKLLLLMKEYRGVEYYSTKEIQEFLEKIGDTEYCIRFGMLLQSYFDLDQDDNNYQCLELPMDIITYIVDMPLPSEEKMKIQNMFLYREKHIRRVIFYIEKVMEVILEFKNELNEQLDKFYKYWSDFSKTQNWTKYLKNDMNLNIEENPFGYRLYISIFNPIKFSFYVKTDEHGNLVDSEIMQIGILLMRKNGVHKLDVENKEASTEYAIQILKILSDKSKFDILTYIKNEKKYGSELSEYLGLTTATISHHMNILLANDLVTMNKDNNRIYYKTNKQVIDGILSYCKSKLTE